MNETSKIDMNKNCDIDKIKSNTLILCQTIKTDYMYLEWKNNNMNTEIIMKEFPKLIRAFRRLWINYNLPFQSFWYGSWKKELKNYKTVIIHASSITTGVLRWIKSKNKNIRIILWYWNPVTDDSNPNLVDDIYCEKWSFDIEDCKKYNMNFNAQYYFKTRILPDNEIIYDIFFIGIDKGRAEKISRIYEFCIENGISTDFNIVTKKSKNLKYKELISVFFTYEEILKHISKSKVILEVLQSGQSSQTLRALEALFFSKKLITDNITIKNCDFYNKDNIFILGEDSMDDLKHFIESPYRVAEQCIIEKYDFNQWLVRFFT